MSTTSDSQRLVELLAEEFLDRCKRGERPTIGEYCARHPEHADEIREVFEALLMVEDLRPGSSNQSASIGDAGPGRHGTRLERVGGYRVLREIGRDGMGVVYEAEQEALGRRVALKVMPGGLTGDAKARARFEREARAAARMHHTNIVPVFDVGQDDGQIYYAMQMIHGQGLDLVIDELRRLREVSGIPKPKPELSIAASLIAGRFAQENLAGTDRQGLSSSDVEATEDYEGSAPTSAVLPGQSELSTAQSNRRAYFRSVAQIGLQTTGALSYAHARGVVHRDIKPSNLLLDAAGVVWVTDFGLAKTGDMGMTQTGDILGTVRYMAPERFRGQCDARSDVYALGLTLYELLALRPAFAHADRLQLIEQIRRAEPSPPRSFDRKVPRDLETVVLKAIDKDPRRRYQSADELGEDLQRFLVDEPVRARRVWLTERLARWVRRNPAVAGLTAGILLVMAAGTVISTWQASRARKAEQLALTAAEAEKAARHEAEEHADETRAVLEFVENKVFAAARPEGLEGGLGREVTLRNAIESSLADIGDSLGKQPLIEARLRQTLGQSFLLLGVYKVAEEQFESARALFTKHRGPDHPDTLRSMNSLADSLCYLGRYEEALKLNEETLALRKARLGPEHPDTLASMNNLGETLHGFHRFEEALKLHEETLALRKARLGPEHPDTLVSMHNLAHIYGAMGRSSEAIALYETILALRNSRLGPDHLLTLAAAQSVAIGYSVRGRDAEALKLREKILEVRKRKLGLGHPSTQASMLLLADSYVDLGRHAEALKLLDEVTRLSKARSDPVGVITVMCLKSMARIYAGLGRHAESLKLYEETMAWHKSEVGANHPDTLWSQCSIAKSMLRLGRNAESAALARQTAELWERQKKADALSLYGAVCARALAAAALGADKSPEGVKQADIEADRAMALLKKAVTAGWNDAAHMAKDTDLDALRNRADFIAMMEFLRRPKK
jgi:serine/threonine protein kinase